MGHIQRFDFDWDEDVVVTINGTDILGGYINGMAIDAEGTQYFGVYWPDTKHSVEVESKDIRLALDKDT